MSLENFNIIPESKQEQETTPEKVTNNESVEILEQESLVENQEVKSTNEEVLKGLREKLGINLDKTSNPESDMDVVVVKNENGNIAQIRRGMKSLEETIVDDSEFEVKPGFVRVRPSHAWTHSGREEYRIAPEERAEKYGVVVREGTGFERDDNKDETTISEDVVKQNVGISEPILEDNSNNFIQEQETTPENIENKESDMDVVVVKGEDGNIAQIRRGMKSLEETIVDDSEFEVKPGFVRVRPSHAWTHSGREEYRIAPEERAEKYGVVVREGTGFERDDNK